MKKDIFYGAVEGVSNKGLPSLISSDYCMRMENMFHDGEGVLQKRKGMEKVFSVAGESKITMMQNFGDKIIFTYGNTLASYDLSAEVIYIIKNDFITADTFSAVVYGDRLYLCNGGDQIGYIDSALSFSFITNAPKAKVLFVHDSRLFAGNTDTDSAQVIWSKKNDFTTWSTSYNPPLPQDSDSFLNQNFGNLMSISSYKDTIVVFYEQGKIGFVIKNKSISGLGLRQDTEISFEKADFGGIKSVSTHNGIFYISDEGIFLEKSGKDKCLSEKLGKEYIHSIDFSSSDIAFLPNENRLLITCAKESDVNNLVLFYDITSKSWSMITGWNIQVFMRDKKKLYGGDAFSAVVYELFKSNSDNGNEIWCYFESGEIDFLSPLAIKKSKNFYAKGNLSIDSVLEISFDVWDKKNKFNEEKYVLNWLADNNTPFDLLGFGEISFGENDRSKRGITSESFGHKKIRIKDYLRIKLKIKEHSCLPFCLNFLGIDYENKKDMKKNNL